jgi:hypothetical protein
MVGWSGVFNGVRVMVGGSGHFNGVRVIVGASGVFNGVRVIAGVSQLFSGVRVMVGASGVFRGVRVIVGASGVFIGVRVTGAGQYGWQQAAGQEEVVAWPKPSRSRTMRAIIRRTPNNIASLHQRVTWAIGVVTPRYHHTRRPRRQGGYQR